MLNVNFSLVFPPASVVRSYVYFFCKKCILRMMNYFLLPNHGGQTFTKFFCTFYNLVMAYLQFLWKWRLKNLQISVSNIIRFSQNLREKMIKSKLERYIIKLFANRITSLNQLPQILFTDFLRLKKQINWCCQCWMPCLNISDASLEF